MGLLLLVEFLEQVGHYFQPMTKCTSWMDNGSVRGTHVHLLVRQEPSPHRVLDIIVFHRTRLRISAIHKAARRALNILRDRHHMGIPCRTLHRYLPASSLPDGTQARVDMDNIFTARMIHIRNQEEHIEELTQDLSRTHDRLYDVEERLAELEARSRLLNFTLVYQVTVREAAQVEEEYCNFSWATEMLGGYLPTARTLARITA